MRIYKDKKTGIYHADYVVNGRRVRPSLHTKNSSVAHLKAGQLLKPADDAYPNCPIENFETKYFAYLTPLRSASTTYRHRISLEMLKEFTTIKTIEDITPAVLSEFQVHLLAQKKGKHNINRILQALKSMMHQAEKWDLVKPRRWQNVQKLKVPKGRIVFHTTEEISAILANCPSEGWRLVVLLGARAGLRRGEIAALQWQDVDFKNNQLYIAPNKTEKHRFVPMPKDLREALQNAQKCSKTDFVVEVGEESARGSKYFISAAYAKNMSKLKVGGKKVHCFLHKLRHTYASHLVQAGVDLYRVSKLLGHSSIQMTEIYAHLAPANLQEAILQLPAIK